MASKYGGIEVTPEREVPRDPTTGRALQVGRFGGREVTSPQELLPVAGEYIQREIQREEPLESEFPEEPGTSRAAQELPEVITGPGVKSFTSEGRTGLPQAAAMVTMTDPEEIAAMMKQNFPEVVGIQYAPDGSVIIANNITGQRALLNRPGISAMDVAQLIGVGAAFFPAGKLAAAPASLTGRIATGMLGTGLTEDIIQRGQEAAGGQYDATDVALSTALGPISELVRPAMGLAQGFGKFVGSYMPRNWFGGIEGIIPQAKAQALNFAKQAGDYLESGRKAIIMTQDALSEAVTPFKNILLKMVERMPITGTGGLRATQREQRVEVLRHLADRFDINPNTNYGKQIVASLNANAGARLDAAMSAREAALDALGDEKVVLRDFLKKVDAIQAEESKFGALGNQGLVNMLEDFRTAVWQGDRKFGSMNDYLERFFKEANNAPPHARELLEEAADSLMSDLRRHAVNKGGEAGKRWASAQRELQQLVKDQEKKTLRALMERGEIDQGVMRRVLKSGDVEDMQFLYKNMGSEGRDAAKQMLMRNLLKIGGWRRGPAGEAPINAKKVFEALDKDEVSAQLRTFFPTEAAQAEIGGLREYLRLTAAAQETGRGAGMAAAIGAGTGQAISMFTNLGLAGIPGLIGRAYQSAPMRNLLLRLYHTRGDKRLQDKVMAQLEPLAIAAGRQVLQDWTESDPYDQVYAAETPENEEEEKARMQQGESTMDQLRREAEEFARETTGVDVGARLREMLNGG